jgi:uncharacterized protein (TIGR00297 family)
MPLQLLLAIAFGLIVALASYSLKFLTTSGALATFLLAVVVFGVGGWQWTVPILAFFVSSSLWSKIGRSRKIEFELLFDKSSRRDWGQVLANGGLAGILVILSSLYPLYDLYPLYLGAIAAVTADTWGTEIGLLSKGATVSVLTFKPVDRGTNGGVSENGFFGGAAGAILIALSGYYWYADDRTAIVVMIAGVFGSLADSVLGATLQGLYRCTVCGKLTERKFHCGERTLRERGFALVTNDAVNAACSVAGALAAWAGALLFSPF